MPICASCGCIKGVGIVLGNKIIEPDPAPHDEFIQNCHGRLFCTDECLAYWAERHENPPQSSPLAIEEKAAMLAGVVTAKVVTNDRKAYKKAKKDTLLLQGGPK